MALPQQKLDVTDARLAALPPLDGKGCLANARADALSRLCTMGLPTRRDEYWKYTRPDTLVRPDAPAAALFEPNEAAPFNEIDRLKLVFVDGVFDAEASDDPAMSGVTIERLSEAEKHDIPGSRVLSGVLEARGQDPVSRPLAQKKAI